MTAIRSAISVFLAAMVGCAGASAADLVLRESFSPSPPPSQERFKNWYLHVGPAGLIYSESVKLKAGGGRVPGADVRIPASLTFAAEIGYFLNPNFAIGAAFGFPPLTKFEARGVLTGLGTLGKASGGPAALMAQYHFTGFGRFQPYVGVGPAILYIFNENDGTVNNLKVEHAVGVSLQAGFNYMIDESWGVFVDAKKVILRTRGSGSLGGVPIKAEVTLDPLVLQAGVGYRF